MIDERAAYRRIRELRQAILSEPWRYPDRVQLLTDLRGIELRLDRMVATLPKRTEEMNAWRAAYVERQAVVHAMRAMDELGFVRPTRVRSRSGMLRLLRAVHGTDKVRWSWPADRCARAHRARPLFI